MVLIGLHMGIQYLFQMPLLGIDFFTVFQIALELVVPCVFCAMRWFWSHAFSVGRGRFSSV